MIKNFLFESVDPRLIVQCLNLIMLPTNFQLNSQHPKVAQNNVSQDSGCLQMGTNMALNLVTNKNKSRHLSVSLEIDYDWTPAPS